MTPEQIKELRSRLNHTLPADMCEGFGPIYDMDGLMHKAFEKLNNAGYLVTTCKDVSNNAVKILDDYLHEITTP